MRKVYFFALALLLQTAAGATPAPDFTVTTSDGQQRKLYQDYVSQQKVVVLELFFTTCPPCATHAPHLQTLYTSMQAAYPGQVEFLLLSTILADTDPVVAAYLTAKGLTMPAAGSSGGSLSAIQPYLSGTFGPYQGTPTFIVIAPGTGEVTFDIRGNSPQETMALISQQIAALLPQEQECFLKSYYDNPVDSVQINVATTGGFSTSLLASGQYTLSDIPELQNADYTITPVKNSDPLSGLSTFDLVKIASHILGLQPFAEPWQSLAADMNCSGTVTTFDIVEGRKVILGINNGFAGCGGATWKFVSDTAGLVSDGGCRDFRGIKIGDITGAYFAPDNVDDRFPVSVFSADRHLEAGEIRRIALFSETDALLSGLQLAFGTDPSALRIISINTENLPGFDEHCYNTARQESEGHVPLSWVNENAPVAVAPGKPLLTLDIEALKDVQISDALAFHPALRAEAYDAAGGRIPLEFGWNAATGLSERIVVAPNPASGRFVLAFEAEREGTVLLQLLDMRGNGVMEEKRAIKEGANRLDLAPEIPEAGVYILKIDGIPAVKVALQK